MRGLLSITHVLAHTKPYFQAVSRSSFLYYPYQIILMVSGIVKLNPMWCSDGTSYVLY